MDPAEDRRDDFVIVRKDGDVRDMYVDGLGRPAAEECIGGGG